MRRMGTACWLHKATNTHSKFVILIAFLLQERLHERVSILRYIYIHRLTCVLIRQYFFVFGSVSHLHQSRDTVYIWLQTYMDTNTLKFHKMEGKKTHVCYKHLHSCVKRLLLLSSPSVRPSIRPLVRMYRAAPTPRIYVTLVRL